ncbi:MAG: protein kinase domain-containing protein [Solirubrobacteraceae bacterium]
MPSDTTPGGPGDGSDATPSNKGSAQDETRALPVTRAAEPRPSAAVQRPAAPLAPGERFGEFEIEAELGRGEMGIVYRVRRRLLDRVEALKVIAPKYTEDPDYAERFLREATHAALAHHPNVVTVYDAGERGGRLYVAMEYVDGEDLRKRIAASGPLPPSTAAEITRQIAGALDGAHAAGLVHRDVKPANILLAERHGVEHAYLADFGVSRRVLAANDLTQPGSFVGAPAYAAPEQHRGQAVDARTDVYSLGCVLFEMLTGEVPFHGTTATAVAIAQIAEPPPTPSAVNRNLPTSFDAIIAKALAKDPDDRYRTALELGDAAVATAQIAVHAATEIVARVVPNVDPEAATMVRPVAAREAPADEAAAEPAIPPAETLIHPTEPAIHPAEPAIHPAETLIRPAETLIRPAESAIRPAETLIGPTGDQPPPAEAGPAHRGGSRAVIAVAAVIAIGAAVGIGLAVGGGGGGDGGGASATVIGQGVNVRTGPNVDASAITSLAASQTVTVSCWTEGSGSRLGWDRLQSPNPGGYVAAGLLNPVITTPQC